MTKQSVINNMFLLITLLSENKVKYGEACNIVESILNNNKVLIKNKDISEEVNLLSKNIELLSDDDKRIIKDSLLKEWYLMEQYLTKLEDKTASYVERERNHYMYVVKDVLIRVLMSYLLKGVNVKKEYLAFMNDYKNYSKYLKNIADILDTNNKKAIDTQLKKALEDRKHAAQCIIEKYSSIPIYETDLRSILERELCIIKDYSMDDNELDNIKELFRIA